MKKIYSILSLLLLCSIVAFADSERVVIANDVASHVVINSIEGNEVTLTVTPAEGQYLTDISAMKTVDASAAAPQRRADIPVGAAYTLIKTSTTADRSQEATYTMTLEDGFGAYVTATFADRTAITADQITLSAASFTYNGSDQKATVSIDGLTLDTDYTISYKETEWKDAGTYTVTITGIDSYKGTIEKTWSINACQSSEAVVALAIPTEGYTYDGTEKTPAVTVTIGTMTVADTEYTVSYTNNVNAGTASVTVEDKQGGNFAFAPVSKAYEIGKKAVTVTADSDSKIYDGTALTKNTYTSTVLAEGDVIESVTVTGSQTEVGSSDNVPGAAVIKNANNVDVTDCYSITYVNGTLTVNACQSSEAVIALAIPTEGYTYDGTEKTPAVTVTIGTMTVADTEYTVSYTNNVNAGTATVTVEDKQGGNFAFAPVSKAYEIGKKAITDNDVVVSISKENKTYEVSVTRGEKTLVENTDYTLGEGAGQTSGSSYNYSIPVTGKGNYTGEVMATWTAAIVAYTVKHYQQNLADDDYPTDATATEDKTGVTGDETEAVAKVYTGFTAQAFSQKNIAADGSTVVSIYYTRNKHNVTLPAAVAGGSITTADGTTDLKYGASITLTVTTNEGYTLKSLCATGGAALTGSGNTRTLTMADQAVSVKADWEEVKEENKTTEVTENVTVVDANNAEVSSIEVGAETTTVTISGTVNDGTNDVPVTSIADGTFTSENTANVLSIDLSETQVDLDMDRKADSSPVKDVPDNTLIYLPEGSTMTGDNVIVKGAGSDFTCNNFVMDDEKSYNVPHPFIASNATLNREFTANQTCTVCLPYDVPAAGVHGKIYTFTSVANNQVTMTEDADGLNANVPYIFVPDGTDNISVTGSITVEIIGNNTSANDFTFKGIYEDHKFTAEEIAKGIYGFAGAKAVGTTPGHFAKAATGAYIKAKRAYLEYTGSATDLDIEGPDVLSPRFGDLDTPLPDSMDVILVDADGTTTNIGKLELVDNDDNARYNLGGQRVGKSHKGMVIENGHKVVIK